MLQQIYDEHGIILPPSLVILATIGDINFVPSKEIIQEIADLVLSDKPPPYSYSDALQTRIDNIISRLARHRIRKDAPKAPRPWETEDFSLLTPEERHKLEEDFYNKIERKFYKKAGIPKTFNLKKKQPADRFRIITEITKQISDYYRKFEREDERIIDSIDTTEIKRELRDSLNMIFEIEIEIERSRSKMITVYHARSSSMLFFDILSKKLRNSPFNKGRKTDINFNTDKGFNSNIDKASAIDVYKELSEITTRKYNVFGFSHDKSVEMTHEFFDEIPEARVRLTAVNLSLFNNFDREGESTAQLWVQDTSVSSVTGLVDYILQNFHELNFDQTQQLKELFLEFHKETTATKSYGQLLSIGIPISKTQKVIYLCTDGGVIYGSGDVIQEELKWDSDPDGNEQQGRLVDVKFEELNTESIDVIDANIIGKYERLISMALDQAESG